MKWYIYNDDKNVLVIPEHELAISVEDGLLNKNTKFTGFAIEANTREDAQRIYNNVQCGEILSCDEPPESFVASETEFDTVLEKLQAAYIKEICLLIEKTLKNISLFLSMVSDTPESHFEKFKQKLLNELRNI